MSIQRLAELTFCAIAFIVCSSIALGQSMSPEERQRIMMVQDVKAVGNSGDKSLTPYLKDVLQSRKVDHREWADVQMALAKLGEREQQQYIRKHEAELSQLVPRGEGVDFSGASCKSKSRERSIN